MNSSVQYSGCVVKICFPFYTKTEEYIKNGKKYNIYKYGLLNIVSTNI